MLSRLLLYFPLALVLLPLYTAQDSNISPVNFHVGVILDLDSLIGRIGMSCLSMAHADFYSARQDFKTRLVFHIRDSNDSVVGGAAAALDLLQDVEVDVIIGPQKSTQVNFVKDLADRAQVPLLSFSATNPSLVPRTPYFVQTAQSDANQVQAIASIVEAFKWSQVVVIYEDSDFGSGIISYLSNALQDVNSRISFRSALSKSATDDFISKELYKMMTMQTRVFVVHVSHSLGTRLFPKAKELGMMSEGFAWIVTSGLTDLFNLAGNSDVVEAMQGVLGVRPLIPKSKELESFSSRWRRTFLQANQDMRPPETSVFGLWAYDALWALAMAAERIGNNGWNSNLMKKEAAGESTHGPFATRVSETGPEILKAFLETRFRGLAGEFNLVNGHLEQTPYEIINVVGSHERQVGIWTPSNGITRELNMNVTGLKSVIWPGDSTKAPKGWEVPVSGKKLRIGVPQKPGFNEFLKVEIDPQTNEVKVSGYYKEIFDAVMAALPYALPYEYSPYPFFTLDGSLVGSYDDLVHRVSLQDEYDGALGDITITANRSIYADFSMPYAQGGVTSIVPIKYEDGNDVLTFLQPLSKELWLTIGLFYISTALAIWILANRTVSSSRNPPGQHAGMICCFPFFPGEGIAANLLCLVLVTWAFIASLLNSTYTASLSSRLTVARLQPTVTNVAQLIKNRDYVGCQEGSFLVDFLVNLGFDKSKIRTFSSAADCDEALSLGSKNGGISAYYDVLPHITELLSQYCGKYKMVSPIYRTGGFAFAFPKGSPVVADISRAIIQLTEHSTILEIEQGLSSNPECVSPDSTSSSVSVTLRSFVVLFVITGCVTLMCLVVSLVMRLHNKRPFPQRVRELSANANSRILALRNYFKQEESASSLPKTRDTEDEIRRSQSH